MVLGRREPPRRGCLLFAAAVKGGKTRSYKELKWSVGCQCGRKGGRVSKDLDRATKDDSGGNESEKNKATFIDLRTE